MNTSRNSDTSLDNLSLIAVVSCLLSAAYLLLTNLIA